MNNEDLIHRYNGIQLSDKKKERMSFTATWMQLKMIIQSDMSERETQIAYHVIYM